jgi:hypothetical protein
LLEIVEAAPTLSGFTVSCTTRMKARVLRFVCENLLSAATWFASEAFWFLSSPSSSSAPVFSASGMRHFSDRLSRKAAAP